MKIRCNDGVTRQFRIAKTDGDRLPDGTRSQGSIEAACEECDAPFGVHDTKILKPMFRKHRCDMIKSTSKEMGIE